MTAPLAVQCTPTAPPGRRPVEIEPAYVGSCGAVPHVVRTVLPVECGWLGR